LALVAAGATIAEAGRAVCVSRSMIYRSARASPRFAERLAAAREDRALTPVEALDWREAARWLEVESPERWALPEMPDDLAM
jgi:hypothetical protein